VGTFFCFSDYMRPAVRLAALSQLPVIYQWTHDSIGLGEDGPTHQPVEQLAALRAMPNLYVMRPGDEMEVKYAWTFALKHLKCPVGLVLSRQGMPQIEECDLPYEEGVAKGAYVVLREDKGKPIDYTLFTSGTELALAMDVAAQLKRSSKNVRVVSCICFELFEDQPAAYQASIVEGDLGKRVAIEAASSFGWHRFIGADGTAITVDTFGTSAPAQEVYQHFGLTADLIVEHLSSPIEKMA